MPEVLYKDFKVLVKLSVGETSKGEDARLVANPFKSFIRQPHVQHIGNIDSSSEVGLYICRSTL